MLHLFPIKKQEKLYFLLGLWSLQFIYYNCRNTGEIPGRLLSLKKCSMENNS